MCSKSKSKDGFIYSTNTEYSPDQESEDETVNPEDQLLEIHIEKKGRGGKIAVLVKGFIGPIDDLKDLCKILKSKCGVGGAVKDQQIIIQGDIREKVTKILNDLDYPTKRIGG